MLSLQFDIKKNSTKLALSCFHKNYSLKVVIRQYLILGMLWIVLMLCVLSCYQIILQNMKLSR